MPNANRAAEVTAQHKAYDAIKERILTLRLRPLTHLKAGDLAEEFEMSRTPVREALVRLEQDGLVLREESGGFQVRPISLKEIVDVYRIRETLEVEAALEAMPYMDKIALDRLAIFLKEARSLLKPEKYVEFVLANRKFHAEIIKISRNEFFERIMQPIVDRVRLVGATLIQLHVARQKEVFEENEQIYLAFKARDPELVEKAVRYHISRAREHATALLSSEQRQIYLGISEHTVSNVG